MSAQITTPLEVVGNLVRTSLPHGGLLVAECFDPGSGQPHTDTSKAYALLFSVSPELREALQRLSDQCARLRLPGQSMSDAERNALEVLAKAEGRA